MKPENADLNAQERQFLRGVSEAVAHEMLEGLYPNASKERIENSVRLFVATSSETQESGRLDPNLFKIAAKHLNLNLAPPARLGTDDGLSYFDYIYTIVTANIVRCLTGIELAPGDPRFHDREFMAALDIVLANRYLVGLGDQLAWRPRCWKILVDHREDWRVSPLMFAIVGINAHLNYDLPFAIVSTCVEMGRELNSGTNHEDVQALNTIFAEHMKMLRQHFEFRLERAFDRSLISRIENILGDLVVGFARSHTWKKTNRLWRVRHDAGKMAHLAKSRDRWVAITNLGLFALDELSSRAFEALRHIPGPTRQTALRALSRTGWDTRRQGTKRVRPHRIKRS